jgi:hypothetical protein
MQRDGTEVAIADRAVALALDNATSAPVSGAAWSRPG